MNSFCKGRHYWLNAQVAATGTEEYCSVIYPKLETGAGVGDQTCTSRSRSVCRRPRCFFRASVHIIQHRQHHLPRSVHEERYHAHKIDSQSVSYKANLSSHQCWFHCHVYCWCSSTTAHCSPAPAPIISIRVTSKINPSPIAHQILRPTSHGNLSLDLCQGEHLGGVP